MHCDSGVAWFIPADSQFCCVVDSVAQIRIKQTEHQQQGSSDNSGEPDCGVHRSCLLDSETDLRFLAWILAI